MRLGVVSYPTLFQQAGGLSVQVVETITALREQGVDVSYINTFSESFADFDVVHIFAAVHSNARIVETASALGTPVVLSTVLHPPFSHMHRLICDFAASLLGKMVGWSTTTTYHHIREGLDQARHLVALGRDEKQMLIAGYRQASDKISVIPNGIAQRFYDATPDRFRETYRPRRACILCVASINSRKNQHMAATAVRGLPVDLYCFGSCDARGRSYLETVEAAAPGQVFYGGVIPYEDPILPSAYAGADLMLLPSLSEVMPISVLEALAAGTPVVMTNNHSLGLSPVRNILEMVDPKDSQAIREACTRILDNPPDPADVRALVQGMSWSTVASQLMTVYQDVIA